MAVKNRKKLFAENFLVYGLGGIISKLIPLIMVPIVTRMMPDSSYYGISDLSNTIISLFSAIAVLGMYDAMYRMFFEKEDEEYKKDICSSAFAFTMLLSLVVAGLMLLFRDQISQLFFTDPSYGNIVMICAISVLVGSTNSIISAPTRMQNKRGIYLIMNTISPVLSYSISIPLLLNGYYLIALPIATACAATTSEIIFAIFNHKWFSLKRIKLKYIGQMLKIALPLTPNFIIYWIFNSSDRVMISNLLTTTDNGIYAVAAKFGQISNLIYTAFAGGWQYFAFSIMKDKDNKEVVSKIFEILLIVSLVTTMLGTSICKWGIQILFSEEYWSAYICIPYLYLAPLLLMLFQIGSNQFLVIKKTWPNMLILSAGAILNIVLNFVLIPAIGIEGASIATFVGYLLSIVLMVIVLEKANLIQVRAKTIIYSLIFIACFGVMRIFNIALWYVNIPVMLVFMVITCLFYWDDYGKKIIDRFSKKKKKEASEVKSEETKADMTEVQSKSSGGGNRSLGLDVLKIILFFFVVLLHVNNREMGGALNLATGNALYGLKALESLAVVAVPCFVLISGYFLCRTKKFQIRKVVFIYVLNVAYLCMCYLLDVLIFKTAFSIKSLLAKMIPTNYYLNFYSILVFIAPLLNYFFKQKQKTQIIYLSVFALIFILFPTCVDLFNSIRGSSFVFPWTSTSGDNAGYTLVYFVFMYLVGGFLSTNKIKIKKRITLPIYIGLTVIITLISIKTEAVWNYNNVLVTCSAIMLFLFFAKIERSSNKVVTAISSCSLGVFVLHTTSLVIPHVLSLVDMSAFVGENILSSMLYVFIATIIIGVGCAAADYLLRLAVSPIKKQILKIGIMNKNIIQLEGEDS